MNLYDFLEEWARGKGWWTYKCLNHVSHGYQYINIAAKWDGSQPDFESITTVHGNRVAYSPKGKTSFEDTVKVILSPGDPEYFTKLEDILVNRKDIK